MQEEQQDTRESDALGSGEVRFEREDVEAVGDPAATSTDAEGTAEPAIGRDPTGALGATPAEADQRGAEQAEDTPIVPIVGAFVGAFVAAKLLGRLGGGDD
jgi:hypothetical protein